jgi:hypothetical protein
MPLFQQSQEVIILSDILILISLNKNFAPKPKCAILCFVVGILGINRSANYWRATQTNQYYRYATHTNINYSYATLPIEPLTVTSLMLVMLALTLHIDLIR